MANQTKQSFYDIIYSSDDNGWYCTVYNRQGKDLYETCVCDTRNEAVRLALEQYPKAMLIKVIED